MKNNNTSENKVAIITGSATGIGYETAAHLARNGFRTFRIKKVVVDGERTAF